MPYRSCRIERQLERRTDSPQSRLRDGSCPRTSEGEEVEVRLPVGVLDMHPLAGLDNDRAAHVNIGSGGCDYSTGELIAIVIGLILGIIPGIILLVVLC